jgi:C4-dicarboxylate-specific signal transduction histidine kinase
MHRPLNLIVNVSSRRDAMTHLTTQPRARIGLGRIALGLAAALCVGTASADLPPDLQGKVDKYKAKLSEWANDPAVVSAVKEANAKGGAALSNAKWEDMSDKDPAVTAILSNPASAKVKAWEEDKAINKLYVRDKDGNLVAGSNKPLLYNVSSRPPFQAAIKGAAWAAKEAKPDPTTQIKSVQISAPIKDGGQVIGVLHSAVSAE